MNRVFRLASLATLLAGALACATPTDENTPPELARAKGDGSPTVTATDPAYGHEGEVAKTVQILGTGFDVGSLASWERNGAPDPNITVLATNFVSTTQLNATITIAPNTPLGFYDVAVTTSRGRQGIGTELFEVTQATAIMGTDLIRGVNDNGQMAGTGPIFWSPSAGLEIVASGGAGWDISDDGLTMVGCIGFQGTKQPPMPKAWTRGASGWVETALPLDPAAGSGNATSVASDPTTGAATAIGGHENITVKKPATGGGRFPLLWLRSGSSWQRIALPGPSGSFINDINQNLMAVGYVDAGAAVWEPDGAGGWTLTVIGPATTVGPKYTEVRAINRTGAVVVGSYNSAAVYWVRTGGGWSAATSLPGGCGAATGIDETGRILLRSCSLGPSWRTFTSAVALPPYSASDIIFLGGLGNRDDGPQSWAISPRGTWIVGSAMLKNSAVGAYWQVF